jgi:hypothetical protein
MSALLAWTDATFATGVRWSALDMHAVDGISREALELAARWVKARGRNPHTLVLVRSKLIELSVRLYQSLGGQTDVEVFSDPAQYERAVRLRVPRFERRSIEALRGR